MYDTLQGSVQLASLPALTMLLGSVAVYVWTPGRVLLACLQCLGGGIILGAIGSELLPRLREIHSGVAGTFSITVGFFAGFILMFFIKSLADEGDNEDAVEREESEAEETPLLGGKVGTWSPLSDTVAHARHRMSMLITDASLSSSLVTWACDPPKKKEAHFHHPMPWGLIAAVALDSFVDGFFLGMSYTAATRAGVILAVATAIEMCFLGLTFSASMVHRMGMTVPTVLLVVAMPLILILGSAVGSLLGEAASESPHCYAAFLSFGVAALIFLVTQELLLEANERQADASLPYINSCLFIGFWAILVIERVVG
eukprot:GGOE01065297.1.p1 GENE.GGOE01065297.1~~GGOE01065297.1.p1  ORF type:complete len:314 (+),score=66.66 GGOE01065297.1:71-1012(+)